MAVHTRFVNIKRHRRGNWNYRARIGPVGRHGDDGASREHRACRTSVIRLRPRAFFFSVFIYLKVAAATSAPVLLANYI